MTNTYVVVGDNNYVYGTFINKKDANEEVARIKHSLKVFGCGYYDEKRKPKTIAVYTVISEETIDVSNIKLLK